MNKIAGKQRGQVAVLYAGIIAVLIGAVALGSDVAVMYVNWQGMQKAADQAVISGAGMLNGTDSTGDSNAIATATTYATSNGILPAEIISGPTVVGHQTISITVNRTVPYLFGRALGLINAPVQVTATAQIQPITGAGSTHLVPFGFVCASPPCSSIAAPGDTFALPGDTQRSSPGNWGGLDFSAQDPTQGYTGSHYGTAVTNGYGGTTPIMSGTTDINTVTGNDVNNFGAPAVQSRYNNGSEVPDASDLSVLTDPNDPRVIIIPMVTTFGNGKSMTLDITGFITALIVPEPGHPSQFYAQVVSTSISGDVASSSGPITGTTKAVLIN